jgi:hypothetical protein
MKIIVTSDLHQHGFQKWGDLVKIVGMQKAAVSS